MFLWFSGPFSSISLKSEDSFWNPTHQPDLSTLCLTTYFHFPCPSHALYYLCMFFNQQADVTTWLLLYSSCSLSSVLLSVILLPAVCSVGRFIEQSQQIFSKLCCLLNIIKTLSFSMCLYDCWLQFVHKLCQMLLDAKYILNVLKDDENSTVSVPISVFSQALIHFQCYSPATTPSSSLYRKKRLTLHSVNPPFASFDHHLLSILASCLGHSTHV